MIEKVMDIFIDHKIDGRRFFEFKNENEILKILNIKALGVRKNLMRYVKKL